jgi:hypothetical protein
MPSAKESSTAGLPQRKARYTVVARLKDHVGRQSFGGSKGKSFLGEMVATGRAEAVFDYKRAPLSVQGTVSKAFNDLPRIFAIELDSEKEVTATLEHLSDDPNVAEPYVAPPRILYIGRAIPPRSSLASGPGDWWLDQIRLKEARTLPNFKDASEVTVAVIDSGVDVSHPDLHDAVEFVNFTTAGDRDTSGHGTHVSGIISGRNRSAGSVDGVCRARVLALKALDPYEPKGYYRALVVATERASVINLSLGGQEDPTETLLLNRAIVRGVTIVAAMGNEKEFGDPVLYPAALEGVIGVGAVDRKLELANFSSTGPHIDLVAPGVGIRSCVPTYKCLLAKHLNYDSWDGTSMAAPFVSAAAALLLAKTPGLKPNQVEAALKTRPCAGQSSFNDEFGRGFLDIAATLV